MKTQWRTAWQGQEIVVYRNEIEVDRLHSGQIERVVLVHRADGASPGDLLHAIVVLGDDCVIFPADTGFAGRVNFERQEFWAERACIYWVASSRASLPWRLRRGPWFLRSSGPAYTRVPRSELLPLIDAWPLQGPQTWEQRKWRRIENSRPFATNDESKLRA